MNLIKSVQNVVSIPTRLKSINPLFLDRKMFRYFNNLFQIQLDCSLSIYTSSLSGIYFGRSGLSTWKYQFSYDHCSQATLSLVSTWMGHCSSVA